ncbi:hypothetical protein ABXS75_09175 [Roseburia hominis]
MMRSHKLGVIAAALAVVLGVSACGATKFDAQGYTKSCLDAVYKEEYKEYADFLKISEEEAKKQMDDDFMESINQELVGVTGLSDEMKNKYADIERQIRTMAKYEVKEAKESDNGFTVTVEVEPSDIYQTLEASAEEALSEADESVDLTQGDVLAQLLIDSVQKSIDKNTYGEKTTVELEVTKEDNVYTLKDAEMVKIQEALFPESTQ